jgi:hypothetical protein
MELITSEQQKRDTGWKENDLGIIFEELVRRNYRFGRML